MISSLRDAVRESILLKGLIGLMMISFGVWGVGDFIGTGALDPSIAVKIGPTEISTSEFQRRFNLEMDRFEEEVGRQVADNPAIKRSVAQAVVQDITQTATISAAAEDLRISIPPLRLRNGLETQTAFQNGAGDFDQTRFMQVLSQNRVSESEFLYMFASDLRRSAVIQPVMANADAPAPLTDDLFSYRNETRIADTLLITPGSLTEEDLPTDAELEALYEENINAYTASEYRKLTALVFKISDFTTAESISDEDVRARYEENRERYLMPMTRRVSQLIFDSQEEAAAVRNQSADGDSLTDLAERAGTSAPIDMGELTPNAPVANLMGDAYNLPVGEISQPVETDLGWHLFEVTAETPETLAAFEDVEGEIRKILVQERGMDAVFDASVDVEDAIAGGTPLKEIAEFIGGSIIEIPAMDQRGQDRDERDISGILDRQTFITTAFSLDQGEASRLLDTPDRDGYYVIHVDEIIPPTPEPLEDVRGDVVALWEKQVIGDKAQQVADKLMDEIGPSTSFAALAEENENVSYAPLGPVTRFGAGLQQDNVVDSRRISPAVLQELFSSRPGEVFNAPVSDGVLIARLNNIIVPDSTGQLAGRKGALRGQLVGELREDLASQVFEAFAERFPAEINNEVIDQTIALR